MTRGFEGIEAGLGLLEGYEGLTMMVPYRLGTAGIGWKFTEKLVSQTYKTIRIGDLFVISSSSNGYSHRGWLR